MAKRRPGIKVQANVKDLPEPRAVEPDDVLEVTLRLGYLDIELLARVAEWLAIPFNEAVLVSLSNGMFDFARTMRKTGTKPMILPPEIVDRLEKLNSVQKPAGGDVKVTKRRTVKDGPTSRRGLKQRTADDSTEETTEVASE